MIAEMLKTNNTLKELDLSQQKVTAVSTVVFNEEDFAAKSKEVEEAKAHDLPVKRVDIKKNCLQQSVFYYFFFF